MNPSDAQDVPRAIDLLHAISSLSECSIDGYSPTELQEWRAIRVIGEMLSSFVDAFISPDWSLTQQVVSLSKYAHMTFVFYRLHQRSFMPHQLYGDTQTTVKNTIFCLAKQQLLDGTQPFYLYDTGDDKLEELFGNVCMQGGHNPNFSFKQLVDQLGAAVDIDVVFTAHPELNQGSRRRKVTRTEHANHLNHRSWTGDVVADNVNLRSAWMDGRTATLRSLTALQIVFDFDACFDLCAQDSVDMLQPIRHGKYPGVSTEQDRSLEQAGVILECHPATSESLASAPSPAAVPVSASADQSSSSFSSAQPQPSVIATGPGTTSHSNHQNPSESDSEGVVTPESDSSSLHALVIEEDTSTETIVPCLDASMNRLQTEGVPGVSLEDRLDEPEEPEQRLPPISVAVSNASPWLLTENGHKIHKSTVCIQVITPDWVRKPHERIYRVRCFSSDTKPRDPDSASTLDPNNFVLGDLFATLMRCDGRVTLAITKCIAIHEKGQSVSRVLIAKLSHASSGIKLTGQVLELCAVPGPTATGSSGESTEPEDSYIDDTQITSNASSSPSQTHHARSTARRTWLWTGSFVKLVPDHTDRSGGAVAGDVSASKVSHRALAVKVSSHVCHILNPRVMDARSVLPEEDRRHLNEAGLTWEFTESELTDVIQDLWLKIRQNDAIAALPLLPNGNQRYPYKASSTCTSTSRRR